MTLRNTYKKMEASRGFVMDWIIVNWQNIWRKWKIKKVGKKIWWGRESMVNFESETRKDTEKNERKAGWIKKVVLKYLSKTEKMFNN